MRDKGNNTVLEGHRRYRRIVMAIVLAPVLAAWFVWGPLGIISYVGGLFNWVWSYAILFYLMWVIPAAVLGFPVLIVYSALTWRGQRSPARRSLAFWIILAGGFACPLGLGFVGLSPSPFDLYVRGFATHMRYRADVGAIQGWLGTLDPNDDTLGSLGSTERRFSGGEQPPCIARLGPKWAMVRPDDSRRYLIVKLLWGSGFIGHWGIVVGPGDMPTPAPGPSERREQRFSLAPGAYIWCDK